MMLPKIPKSPHALHSTAQADPHHAISVHTPGNVGPDVRRLRHSRKIEPGGAIGIRGGGEEVAESPPRTLT